MGYISHSVGKRATVRKRSLKEGPGWVLPAPQWDGKSRNPAPPRPQLPATGARGDGPALRLALQPVAARHAQVGAGGPS